MVGNNKIRENMEILYLCEMIWLKNNENHNIRNGYMIKKTALLVNNTAWT